MPDLEEALSGPLGVILTCCGCLCVCGLIGGGITVLVFTCIFLDIDKDKGGSDPTCLEAGDAIWTYVIVRLVLGWVSGLCNGTNSSEGGEEGAETNLVGICCQFTITTAIVIYGAVVIFHKDVCDQYKNTGLYQMYYIMFWIDVSVLCFLVLCFLIGFIGTICGGMQPTEIHQNIRNSISRASINLSAADAVDLSGETLAEADAEKVKEDPVTAEAIVIAEIAEGTPAESPADPTAPTVEMSIDKN